MTKNEPGTADEQRRELDIRVLRGLSWTAGAKWATQLITWGSLLFLVRILTPADYGIGAMAGTLAIVSNVMAEFGVGTAVLHMPELSRRTLAQLHLYSCLLCTGVFVLATLAAPLVASFYHTNHLAFFIATNTLLFLTGFEAVPMGLLAREMDYRRLSLAEAAAVLVQSLVTIVTALLGWGYWALLAGGAAGKTTATIMVCSWKHVGFAWPRWKDIRAPVELGRQAAISRVAWSLYAQADGIVVGRVLGAPVLGVYGKAMDMASAPAEKISTLLMRTASPLFANVKDDRFLVRRYYLILAEILSLVTMPLMLGLMMVAPLAVQVVFGSRWLGASGPVRWLAIFMIVRTMGTLTEQVLISQFRTRFTMRMSLVNFVLMPIAFIAGARWMGTVGVAAAWVLLAPFTIVPLLIVLFRAIELPYSQYLAALTPAIAGSAAMCLTLFGFNNWVWLAQWPAGTRLSVLVLAGAIVYSTVLLGFFRERIWRYVRFLNGARKGQMFSPPEIS